MRAVLDVVPGSVAFMTPTLDAAGVPVDWTFVVVSPGAVDSAGRRATDLTGQRLSSLYPGLEESPVFGAYRRAWVSGEAGSLGPFPTIGAGATGAPMGRTLLRFNRVADGMVVSWVRIDLDARGTQRLADTERMGKLGYAVWHVDGRMPNEWSENLYRIFCRTPAQGPLDYDEFLTHLHDDDRSEFDERVGAMLAHGDRMDIEVRALLPDGERHLRVVAEVARDSAGLPFEVYCLVQDDTTARLNVRRLVSTQRELEEQQRRLAEELRFAGRLQEIILPVPDGPLTLPGLHVAVRYLPAERAGRVGGDWYHALPLRDGSVLLAVGDVAGHGLPAAAVMAQLRHALSGLVAATGDPARLLALLNTILYEQVSPQTLATAVVARYDPATRVLTWAQAGHPPCLLVRDGTARRLARPDGLILGAVADVEYRTATTRLRPDDLLLMYTDGLVEGPVATVEEGVDRLAATVAAMTRAHTEGVHDGDLAAAVVHGVPRANPHDDTCVLAARAL
jgi:serine phosphatase RsbU (regulator of sigma subunit)